MRGDAHDTLEKVRSKLKELQTDVAKAKKVIIIGGGPVGLEYAGVSLKVDMRKLARILANET
jgi:NADPH-dependent 2,4-dienoyl-CoA reductase/sulfur reductase-like enzyme